MYGDKIKKLLPIFYHYWIFAQHTVIFQFIQMDFIKEQPWNAIQYISFVLSMFLLISNYQPDPLQVCIRHQGLNRIGGGAQDRTEILNGDDHGFKNIHGYCLQNRL